MKTLFYLFISILGMSGCSVDTKMKSLNQNIILVNPDNAKENLLASELFENLKYIPLESKEESLFGEISQLIIYKDRFYILDENHTQAVYCFDSQGRFIYKIKRSGSGPGEYKNLINIGIDPEKEELFLHCAKKRQILVFDLEGNYKTTHNLGFVASKFICTGGSISALYLEFVENQKFEGKDYYPNLIFVENETFKVTKQGLSFKKDQANTSARSMLLSNFSIAGNNKISLTTNYCDTIYHLEKDRLTIGYYFDFGEKKKGPEFYKLLENNQTQNQQIKDYLNGNDVCNIQHFIETENQIFFVYQNKANYHFAFFNKKSKDLMDAGKDVEYLSKNGTILINDLDGGLFPLPYFSDGTSFYSFIQPFDLLNKVEAIEKKNSSESKNLMKIISRVKADDNPIITILTPKK
jgi:hypothetical protein